MPDELTPDAALAIIAEQMVEQTGILRGILEQTEHVEQLGQHIHGIEQAIRQYDA